MHDFELTSVSETDVEPAFCFSVSDLTVTSKARALRSRLARLVEDCQRRNQRRLGLGFSEIDRISSAGLNELIAANTHARTSGIRIVLLDVSEPVRDVFKLTRLERMFEFADSPVNA